MENKEKLSVGKIILIIILVLLIGAGLFGAGCGGFFAFNLFNRGDTYLAAFSIIWGPSLIIGLLLIFGGYKGIKKILKGRKVMKSVKESNDIKRVDDKIEY